MEQNKNYQEYLNYLFEVLKNLIDDLQLGLDEKFRKI